MSELALFPLPPGAVVEPAGLPSAEKVSADRRRTLRQAASLAAGYHPLGGKLHPGAAPADDRAAAGRRCGNCWFRQTDAIGGVAGSYPKCTVHDGLRITRSAASDCRAWWPACVEHSYGDQSVSDDAARYVPGGAA